MFHKLSSQTLKSSPGRKVSLVKAVVQLLNRYDDFLDTDPPELRYLSGICKEVENLRRIMPQSVVGKSQ